MAYIGKEPIVGNFQVCDAISVVNGQAAYTLQVSSTNVVPESANHMLVSLNGVLQAPVTSFTVSSSTLTFASNLATGDVIDFVILLGNVLDIGVPSDDSVTLAKMASGTDGNIISYDASGDPVAIATGNDGQVLTSAGAGAPPAFETLSAGKILQVVEGTHATAVSTTSTSYVTTGLDVAITCSATSSKVLIICTFPGQQSGSDAPARFTIYKASADLDSTGNGFGITRANVANIFASIAMTVVNSPSSTSELTYTAYMKVGSGTGTSCTGNSPGRIIAMEIGA